MKKGQRTGKTKKTAPKPPAPDKERSRELQAQAKKVLPIVGMGSSAGGLEALQDFFKHMPEGSGAAFVVVTHQHAGRTSLLPELLAKATSMPVVEAREGIEVQPDHVYVAMPDGLLEIAGGRLRTSRNQGADIQYRPIDHFLRFLAVDQAEHAICIILSGAGSDGTLGVKEVKAAGGMAMVQEPSSAKYASMPVSANETGLADYVLSPSDMPKSLLDYVRGPYLQVRPPTLETHRLPEEAITRILVSLRGKTGHDFTGYKRNTISRRIERRMNVHHIERADEYVHYLSKNPQEAKMLMQELLISVTSFFRDPEAFHRAFRTDPARVEGGSIFDLDGNRWDQPGLRAALGGILAGKEALINSRIERFFTESGERNLLLSARRLDQAADLPVMILLTVEDVTGR